MNPPGTISITVTDLSAQKTVFTGSFDAAPVRIGRHDDNDVSLRGYPFVSRWHAEVVENTGGDGFMLHMLARHNPLIVGAERIETGSTYPIKRRVVATLGPLKIDVRVESELPVFDQTRAAKASPKQANDTQRLPVLPDLDRDRQQSRSSRLEAAILQLRPFHTELQRAREAWEDACVDALRDLREADDAEPEDARLVFREFPASDRPSLAREDNDLFVGVGEIGLVVEAASELLPGRQPPTGEADLRRFLSRVVDVIRVFASCTIELQRMRDRQAGTLGVAWVDDADPLIRYDTRDELLRYLVDYRDAGAARSEELVRLFSALVDHVDAYIDAAKRGARAALLSLAPSEMERSVSTPWPTRTAALWRHYERCFAAFLGDSYDNLTPALRGHLAHHYTDSLARLGVPFESKDIGGER